MEEKDIPPFLASMYDYADYLVNQIGPDNPDNGMIFISLVHIEDMMDMYGRLLIARLSKQIGGNPSPDLNEAHRRLDMLRSRMNELRQEYDFDQAIEETSTKLARNWLRDKSSL